MTIIDNLRTYIQTHFQKDPFFLWCVFVVMSFSPVVSFLSDTKWLDALFILVISYSFSCLLTLVLSFLGVVGHIVKDLCLTVGLIYAMLAVFCLLKFGVALDTSIFETLLETNPNEMREFFDAFVPTWTLVLFFVLLLSVIVSHLLCVVRYRLRMSENQARIHLYLMSYLLIVMAFCPQKVLSQIQSVGYWTIPFDNIAINLRDYEPDHIDLSETRTDHPRKIIMIIGESHSLGHTSLYGYDKDTYPQMAQLRADGKLSVFSHVNAPATATVLSFKYILNTRHADETEREWYTYPSVITILRSAGYLASWYSNQDEVGLHDNMASCYAHICDHYGFNANPERLDGNLPAMHIPADTTEFVIYHLMGQHVDFSKRYPSSFAHFTADDYDPATCSKRDVAAHYDNACLYNDHVIASVIGKYSHDDAVVIYFPDHGLDVFQSSPDYYGHVRSGGRRPLEYGQHIPFLIYMTDTFRSLHPTVVQRIDSLVDVPFCTADITYRLMEIAGYDLIP